MSKFTFTYNFVPDQLDRSNIAFKTTVEFEADTLDEVLGQFTQFLRGAGFYFEGDVEIVDNSLPLTIEDTHKWTDFHSIAPLSGIETKDIPVPANLEVKGKFYPSGPANPTIYNMVDPPTGWRYGFPMRYEPDKDGNLEDFLIKNGYPAKDVKFALEHSRFWYESDNEEKT